VILIAQGLETRLEWCDPDTGAREPLWTANGDVGAFDVAPGPQLCVSMWNGNGPLEVWTGEPGQLAQRSHHHDLWKDVSFGPVEDFYFTAVDGRDLDESSSVPRHRWMARRRRWCCCTAVRMADPVAPCTVGHWTGDSGWQPPGTPS
jgi:hypothetical protein